MTHQFRIGVESTGVCECEYGIDDANHFLLQCTMVYGESWNMK